MDFQKNGLNKVYTPSPGTTVAANVVFVHGLFGHPYKTWATPAIPSRRSPSSSTSAPGPSDTSTPASSIPEPGNYRRENFVFWPRDLLPDAVPNVRIYSWGYDADIDNFMSSAGQNTVLENAKNLLGDLSDLNDDKGKNYLPFIFVVHSLGGLVVKDALNQALQTEDKSYKGIAHATFGICFLGTPHRGSKTASIGRRAYRMTEFVAARRPNTRLLQALERNSETLNRIGDGFIQTLHRPHHDYRICSFKEEKEVGRMGLFSTFVVPSDSASIGHSSEKVLSIPKDHTEMAKFATANEIGFVRVSNKIREWVKEISNRITVSPGSNLEACLTSLNDTATRARIEQVTERYRKSFEWLFNPEIVPFCNWLSDKVTARYPIFWINGKPGSGKSTLMKFAMNDPRTLAYLTSQDEHGPAWKVIGFFFHERGSEIQKSIDGMFRELAYQILSRIPRLYAAVQPWFERLVREQGRTVPEWDTNTLEHILLDMFQAETSVPARICLFLNALDENLGDNNRLVSFLRKLVSGQPKSVLKICLASRPWSIFEKHFGHCPRFAIHDYTMEDIQSYTNGRLIESYNKGQIESSLNIECSNPLLQDLARQIADKAHGVFIWVRLVVDEVCTGLLDGTPILALRNEVSGMPEELKDLYARTFRRIDQKYIAETVLMLKIALSSPVPLSLRAFLDCTTWITLGHTENQSFSDMKSRLVSRTGGLLEVISQHGHLQLGSRPKSADLAAHADSPDKIDSPSTVGDSSDDDEVDDETDVVQFVHQTVRTFVSDPELGLNSKNNVVDALRRKSGEVHLLRCSVELPAHTPAFRALNNQAFELANIVDKQVESGLAELSDVNVIKSLIKELYRQFRDPVITRDTDRTWYPYRVLHQDLIDRVLCMEMEFSPEHVDIIFAILANLRNLVRALLRLYQKNGAMELTELNLLAVAALGPRIVTDTSCRTEMICLLLDCGYPADRISDFKSWSIVLPGLEFHELGAVRRAEGITFLAALIVLKRHPDMGNETRLKIAEMLLQHGASPDASVSCGAFSASVPVSIAELAARFLDVEWTRLFLRHGGSVFLASKIRVGADIRLIALQDTELKRVLYQAGATAIEPFKPQREEDDAVKRGSAVMALTAGGVGYPLICRGFNDIRPGHLLPTSSSP